MHSRKHLALLIGWCLIATTATAQDDLTNVPDPDPVVQEAALQIADGFEVNLFVSDPMIDKPIQMAWDEEGRLWLATSTIYPQPVPGQTPNDKIFVVEDTDGDGTADRSTVFADGLLTPTGIEVGYGGVFVANSTEILHLKDTDGDGKADQRRVVLAGFGADDTHHLIHSFRWGPDGLFYINQSIYIFSHVETPWGVRRFRAGGIWHFDPDTGKLEVLSYGMVNPWGHSFDRWGQSFATDGAYGDGINYVFPGATFVTAFGAERILQGLNPGQPKQAGLTIISGRHFPEAWQNHMVTNDFRANRVNVFAVSEDEGGYRSVQQNDLIWTDHVAFRPVDVSQGPDGALYLVDWYNPIIQHGEVDFRDPRRDHKHGRIWRITAKGRPIVKPPVLKNASVEALLEALKEPEAWTRRQAKRLLKERGAATVHARLDDWTARQQDPHNQLEALWTYQAIGALNEDLLGRLLRSDDHRVRAAAVRVLYHQHDQVRMTDAWLAELANDAHPRVRREALHVLQKRGTAEAARQALAVLDHPMDTNLDFALWFTLRELAPFWTGRLKTDPDFFGSDTGKLVFALQSVNDPDATQQLARLYAAGDVPVDRVEGVLGSLAERGGPEEIGLLLELVLDGTTIGTNDRSGHLEAVESAAERGVVVETPGRIQTILKDQDESVQAVGARLTGLWGVTSLRTTLEAWALDGGRNESLRQAALQGLASFNDETSWTFLIDFTKSDQPDPLRIQAATLLPLIKLNEAASVAVDLFKSLPVGADATPIFATFARQEGGMDALVSEIMARSIPQTVAQQGLDFFRNWGGRVEPLRNAFVASGAQRQQPRMALDLSRSQLNTLEREVKVRGNPVRGEALFRRPSMVCTNCHAVGGAGGQVGPDLSSMGVQAPMDYLMESLLKPEQAIKDGYALMRIVKKDGAILTGNFTGETSTSVSIRDAGDNVITIPISQIDQREIIPGSLMPTGLMAQLDRDEFIDLVAFLSKLGEEGEYRVNTTPQVRRWRVLQPNVRIETMLQQQGPTALLSSETSMIWTSAYSKVDGTLPMAEVPAVGSYQMIAFELNVQQAGQVVLGFNQADGIQLWNGTEPLGEAQSRMTLNLQTGLHRITLAVQETDGALQIKLDEAATTARVLIVGGK